MVLHGIALHLMILHSLACHCIVLYGVAWYCIVGFGARAVSRKTPTYFMLIPDKCSGSGNSSTMLTSIASTISRFSILMIMIKIMIIVIMMMIIVVIMMMMMKYLNVDLLEPQAESWEKSSQIDHCHDFRTPPFSFFSQGFFLSSSLAQLFDNHFDPMST